MAEDFLLLSQFTLRYFFAICLLLHLHCRQLRYTRGVSATTIHFINTSNHEVCSLIFRFDHLLDALRLLHSHT